MATLPSGAFVRPSVRTSVRPSFFERYRRVVPSVRPSACLVRTHLPIRPSLRPSVHPSVHRCFRPSYFRAVRLCFLCLRGPTSVRPSTHPSFCHFVRFNFVCMAVNITAAVMSCTAIGNVSSSAASSPFSKLCLWAQVDFGLAVTMSVRSCVHSSVRPMV